MNSRQLESAILLSEIRSFSQVADKLKISQPALSKQILSLENELGIKLFDRSQTPVTLTPAGEFFIQKAKILLYEEDQLIKSLDRFKSGECGRLVIGVTPFRSIYLMPDIVSQMKERYPGVQVILHEANSATLRAEVAEGKYDFAIVNLPVDDSTLNVIPLEPDTLVLAVPRNLSHLLPNPNSRSVSFAECSALPFVVVGQSQEMRQLFNKLCAQSDIIPNIACEVVGITTAWSMACAGVGATLLPLQFVRTDLFAQELILLEIKDNGYSRQPAIVTKRGQYLSNYARAAISMFSTY